MNSKIVPQNLKNQTVPPLVLDDEFKHDEAYSQEIRVNLLVHNARDAAMKHLQSASADAYLNRKLPFNPDTWPDPVYVTLHDVPVLTPSRWYVDEQKKDTEKSERCRWRLDVGKYHLDQIRALDEYVRNELLKKYQSITFDQGSSTNRPVQNDREICFYPSVKSDEFMLPFVPASIAKDAVVFNQAGLCLSGTSSAKDVLSTALFVSYDVTLRVNLWAFNKRYAVWGTGGSLCYNKYNVGLRYEVVHAVLNSK